MKKQETSILAVLGFIFAFIFPIAGLVLCIVALNEIKRDNKKGHGLAVAGLTLSIVFIVLGLFMILFGIALFGLILGTVATLPENLEINLDSGCYLEYPFECTDILYNGNTIELFIIRQEFTQVESVYTDESMCSFTLDDSVNYLKIRCDQTDDINGFTVEYTDTRNNEKNIVNGMYSSNNFNFKMESDI